MSMHEPDSCCCVDCCIAREKRESLEPHYPHNAVAEMLAERRAYPNRETFRLSTWRVQIALREDDYREETHFKSEGLAKLGVEWALEAHLEKVHNHPRLASEVEVERRTTGEGGVDIKVVWWKHVGAGYVAMKDYFYAEPATFERTIIG